MDASVFGRQFEFGPVVSFENGPTRVASEVMRFDGFAVVVFPFELVPERAFLPYGQILLCREKG